MFRFVQWEIAGWLGPGDGRYVVRPRAGEGPEQVLVIASPVAGAARRRGRGRRPRSAVAGVVTPPAITRATVIEASPLVDSEAAERWLAQASGREAEATVGAALDVLNRALHSHRVASADPYVTEVARDRPASIRVGYGTGDQVADGRWEQAREIEALPTAPRSRREAALQPQERLAALLGGRDAALACEELALRGRLDFDRGRDREGILQAHLALEAAHLELAAWRELRGMAERLADLESRREVVASAARRALEGGIDDETRAVALVALERVQAALRARSAGSRY